MTVADINAFIIVHNAIWFGKAYKRVYRFCTNFLFILVRAGRH